MLWYDDSTWKGAENRNVHTDNIAEYVVSSLSILHLLPLVLCNFVDCRSIITTRKKVFSGKINLCVENEALCTALYKKKMNIWFLPFGFIISVCMLEYKPHTSMLLLLDERIWVSLLIMMVCKVNWAIFSNNTFRFTCESTLLDFSWSLTKKEKESGVMMQTWKEERER